MFVAELRLARLYSVNTCAPIVKRRTVAEIHSEPRAMDLPLTSPIKQRQEPVYYTMVNSDPWRPAGPATKLLVCTNLELSVALAEARARGMRE